MLYYIILYYVILCFVILYYTILSYLILSYIILYYVLLYYIILYYLILSYLILCFVILYYIILYYSILHYIILYFIILYYIILYYIILCIYMCTHAHICMYIYIYIHKLHMYQNERVCTALVQVSFDMCNRITEVPASQEAFQDASARGGPRDARAAQLQHAGDSHRHGAETSDPEPPGVVGPSQRLRHLGEMDDGYPLVMTNIAIEHGHL